MMAARWIPCLAAFALVRSLGAASSAFNVRDFGARGDGATNDAPAINRAIEAAAAAGGGTVDFPAGTYLSGSVHLRSNVELRLGPGSTLEASPSGADYDRPEPNPWGDERHYQDEGHSHWHDSLLWGENLVNVSITGPGRIFGKGLTRVYPKDDAPQRIGNKSIALRDCRNVTLRGFTIEHGGWFGILATGVDNLVIDGLTIDTNRDGMDIDCCHNVRITDCSVNSPWDDGICLKSSFGLGRFRSTENVTIADCLVSGYDEGTLLDGRRLHDARGNPRPTGRIKFGTESNGGFQAVTIANCVFECCHGLALETVDGADLEDVAVTNLAMRQIYGAPIFLRLGARMRGPENTPLGTLRRVVISNVAAERVEGGQGILIVGLPDAAVQDVSLRGIRISFAGGGSPALAGRAVPELRREYPEPDSFGPTPGWGLYARHVEALDLADVVLSAAAADGRPAFVLDDVRGAFLDRIATGAGAAGGTLALRGVTAAQLRSVAGIADQAIAKSGPDERP